MARNIGVDGKRLLIEADNTTAISLPYGVLYPPVGYEVTVLDNLGTASGANIVITGPIGASVTTATISSNYGKARFEWNGTTYNQLI